MNLPNFLIFFLALSSGYLLGSFPTGFLAGKWVSGIDLREIGSGSTGATNVLRHVGKGPALIVFLLDVLKGIAAISLSRYLDLGDYSQVAAGLAALAGHIWPIWLQWKGGKAVATGLGILIGLSWPVGLASLGIFLLILSISKIVSLSSIISALCLPALMSLRFNGENFRLAYLIVSFAAMAMVIWRHRSNLQRLIAGTEPKIGKIR